MIWNDRVLFIHTPKTAGMSMTGLLTENLEGRVFLTGPYDSQFRENDVVHIPGKRHETLCDAESFFTYRNKSISDFEKIFVIMRNPYSLELSRYSYLRQDLPQDRGLAQKIAIESNYKEYLKSAPFFGMNPPRLNMFYQFNGIIPDNLVVLKFENLNQDIKTYLAPYLNEGYELHHENASKHDEYSKVYDEELEDICFQRNRWFFEKGFYQRMMF